MNHYKTFSMVTGERRTITYSNKYDNARGFFKMPFYNHGKDIATAYKRVHKDPYDAYVDALYFLESRYQVYSNENEIFLNDKDADSFIQGFLSWAIPSLHINNLRKDLEQNCDFENFYQLYHSALKDVSTRIKNPTAKNW